jgi:hypothetical protein
MRYALLAMVLVAGQSSSVSIQSDADAVRVLGISAADVRALRAAGVLKTTAAPRPVPPLFEQYPVPQALAVNAEARAKLKAQGAAEHDIEIGEMVGAFADESNGYWFGKTFYDAEGDSGRGDIGYLSRDGKYSMLNLPELRRWSVSALLVEPNAIWAGMIHRGEGPDLGHGILRFDRKTKRVTVYPLSAPIHTLARAGDRLFAGTDRGPFMLKDDVVTRLLWRN